MAQQLEDVYCTLLMSDSYLPGAAVLAHSLRDAGTTKKLAVLVTLETLSADTITELKALYDYLIPVERIRNSNLANLYLLGRPDLSFTFTKIALWRQTQFRKIVYLDADVVALRALDELFNIDAPFAAAPDIGWPDAFNSGVMVITPDMGEYWALQTMAATGDSFDGADQGLLNQYFEHRPWQRLKFTYNVTPNAEYQWEPAYRYYKRDISAVHFIGKTKPWSGQRSSGAGVYRELLARWWAVYDRHLRLPKASSKGQQKGEAQSTQSSASHLQSLASVPNIVLAPDAPAVTNEQPMSEHGEVAENIDQGVTEPTPTVQQRKFSAPEMEWDATKFEPPMQSRPEAANFPSQTYTFSDSHTLFKAPHAYPDPPRDMWYKVPETKPKPAEAPKPIFPWEREADRPRATRVFAEDLPLEPSPTVSSPVHAFSTVHYEDDNVAGAGGAAGVTSPESVSSPKSADEHWQAFQQSSANVWDSVPGIETYVRAIVDSHGRRGKTQILQQVSGTEDLGSPLLERRNRRESLILTDFPSAIERPSLPVTPAAVRRPTFWSEEKNETSDLPGAEGVVDQVEWNPQEKLELLRRSSLVEFEHLKKDEHPNPPLRALPEHSVLEKKSVGTAHSLSSGGGLPHGSDKNIGLDGAAEKKSKQPSTHGASTGQMSPTGQASTDPAVPGPFPDEQAVSEQTVATGSSLGGDTAAEHHLPSTHQAISPERSGIAEKDFAGTPGATNQSEGVQDSATQIELQSSSAGQGESGRFFTEGGFPPVPSSSFHQSFDGDKSSAHFSGQDFSSGSSSTFGQTFSSSTSQHSSSTHRDSSQHHSLSTGHQIRAGNTTFTLPDFGDGSAAEAQATGDEILSPTQFGGEGDDKKEQGLL